MDENLKYKINDAIVKYDLAKRQEEDFKSAEIKELRLILAALCMNSEDGTLYVHDKAIAYLRNNNPKFEWNYDARNRRHILRIQNETT